MAPFDLLVILGATASGKTAAAVKVARVADGEIISADSRQVYRGMDIGTGKDLAEYAGVPYHLIDVLAPGEDFSLFHFIRQFKQAFDNIRERGRLPMLVGGTGLYLDAVIRGYELAEVPQNDELRRTLDSLPLEELRARLLQLNPSLHNTTDLLDTARLIRAIEIASTPGPVVSAVVHPIVFGIRWDRETLRQRIRLRLKQRMDSGLVEEVRRLHEGGVSLETLDFYGLEYRYVAAYLRGDYSKNDMFQKLYSAICEFAKKQDTWFRRMEKHGIAITWVHGGGDPADAILTHLRRVNGCCF